MIEHETTLVKWKDMSADIDCKIAPLILNLWKLGFYTTNSCEENQPGIIWIEFINVAQGKVFLNLIARASKNLYENITGFWDHEDNWQYDVNVDDWRFDVSSQPKIDFLLSVRFPIKHLKEVEEVVAKVLKR
jgi:hypothetical protein